MEVEAELVGGLGNQLFGYFAGLYFCEKLSGNLTLNLSNLNRPQHFESDIRGLELFPHVEKINKWHDTSLKLLQRRVRDKALLVEPRLAKLLYRDIELVQDTNVFGENVIGGKSRILLRGYFGNFQYYENISKEFRRVSVREPSQNYIRLTELAKSNRPIMLHVRRGDYVTHANVYGLLSNAYYREALSIVANSGLENEIWVFSDNIEEARTVLSGIKGVFRYIEEEFTLNPTESLLVQSLGSVNIIANSTFSAWAAALNDFTSLKICPQQYFIDGRNTPHWPPKSMKAIDSKWQ